ncbi:PfkB family carbohydrate kinase [Propioniciclava sp. MC1595]|uniref:carbohydrate kinase family protein n=1 Tax=Propioniciclava sp. MC1595 TaxID=2760308 RepID=UPI001CB769FA
MSRPTASSLTCWAASAAASGSNPIRSSATASGAVHVPARPVEVVDVIGAGDALCAGYLSGRLDGLGVAESLRRGVDVASACVASAGDWEGLPGRPDRP